MKNTQQFVDDTLDSLDKLIDTLVIKKKHEEEAVIKLIFSHLGFLINYIDGEKELNAMVAQIKKDVKEYIKLEKEAVKNAPMKVVEKKVKAPAKKAKKVAKKKK